MAKKTYNYTPTKSWGGGTGPNRENFNGTKKDFNAYLKAWDEFNAAIEKLTGMTVTGYDPGINLTEIKDGKWIASLQLPAWFAKRLIDKFEKCTTP